MGDLDGGADQKKVCGLKPLVIRKPIFRTLTASSTVMGVPVSTWDAAFTSGFDQQLEIVRKHREKSGKT